MKYSFTIWLTGLPCSGKTTIADALCEKLYNEYNIKCVRLDGDVVRKTLCSDLGFSKFDRLENIKRMSYISKFINDSGVPVIASFVSPTNESRNIVCDIVDNVKIVYVSTPLSICKNRDTKGMYLKSMNGDINNFTGVQDIYEIPKSDYIEIDGSNLLNDESIDKLIKNIGVI